MGGNFRSDNLGQAGHELGRGEALLRKHILDRLAQHVGERPRVQFAGLVHGAPLCHIVSMTVAARASSRKRAADAGPQPDALLAWYDRHRRVLPWRAREGETPDPYRVWLSEIMLQQTTV